MAETLLRVYHFLNKRAPFVKKLSLKLARLLIAILEIVTSFSVTKEVNLQNILMLLGSWESGTTALNRRILKRGMIVVDVGAHVGYYTTQYAKLVGTSGRVFAFEPHPGNRSLLQKNVRSLKNVEVASTAVGADTTPATFYESAVGSGSHSLVGSRYKENHARELTVQKTTLDTFFKEKGVRPQFIKVDVEGAEHEVIEGAKEILGASDAPDLVMEFSPSILTSRNLPPDSLPRTLLQLGYSLFVIDEKTGETIPIEKFGTLQEFVSSVKKVSNLFATKKSTA